MTVDAIVNTPEQQLRAVMKALLTSDNNIHVRAANFMQTLKVAVAVDSVKRKADRDAATTESKKPKLVEDFRSCANCGKAYFESKNHKRACFSHPGMVSSLCLS